MQNDSKTAKLVFDVFIFSLFMILPAVRKIIIKRMLNTQGYYTMKTGECHTSDTTMVNQRFPLHR